MASKSKFKFSFEPVIIFIIAVITAAVFLLNKFVPSLNLGNLFTSATTAKGSFPFSFKSPQSICRLILYIFGTRNLSSWILLALLFCITPEQENNYGTVILLIMIVLSSLFSGVLCACFLENSVSGPEPVLCLMTSLSFLNSFRKNELKFAPLFILAFFVVFELSMGTNFIAVFIFIAGGLCGSLVSYITVKKSSPKKKSAKKDKATTVVYFDNEADSPRFKNKKSSDTSNDETVIGTLEFD